MNIKIRKIGIKEIKTKTIILIIVIIFIIIIRITNTTQLCLGPVESTIKEIFLPTQKVSYSTGTNFVNLLKGFIDYKNIKDENIFIKQKLSQLETYNNTLQEYRTENEKLRNILKLKQNNNELDIVTGEVVGRSIKNWYKTISINRGINDKIKENMPAITYKGLIGRVTSVTKNTSEITLISDPKYGAIAALTKETRYPGIVVGAEDSSGIVRMIQIPSGAPIQEGFEVVTSGLGDMVYKNLKIGKIKFIKNASDGLMKEAIIEPYEDLRDLNFIMIIIK